MKILVVDDSLTARQMLVKGLRELDQKDVIEAENGVHAFEKLSKNPDIALILLDRYMPEMDGLAFIRKLKENPSLKRIKVSMVTTEADADEKFKTVAEYEADYYITKPVTAQALVRMFAKLFPDN